MGQVTGTVYVNMNGKRLRSKEGASLDMGGFERTAQMSNGTVAGFSEKPVPAVVSCTLLHMSDTDLKEINDFQDGTVTFETDTGLTYIVNEAFTTKPCKLTGGEGEIECEFSGLPADEA